jgi:hypothetical protein
MRRKQSNPNRQVRMARPPKTQSHAKTPLRDLFRQHVIPPSPVHELVQTAAQQEGWIPPWERDEQQHKKREAGKRSAMRRAGLAQMRHSLIQVARPRLERTYQNHPYSNEAIDALRDEICKLLSGTINPPDVLISLILKALSGRDKTFLRGISRETLKKDMKTLGIRSKSPKKSG